ncbi:hypothetical protein TNCV_2862591 [Trichonephila clavipes]|nr:hypothetical protein TNCV_2862591 [Trichonephila clavipes]
MRFSQTFNFKGLVTRKRLVLKCKPLRIHPVPKKGLIENHPVLKSIKGSGSNGLRAESPYCSKRHRNVCADTCCLANDPNSGFRARDLDA